MVGRSRSPRVISQRESGPPTQKGEQHGFLSLLNSERGGTSPPFSCRSVSTAWKPSVGSGGMPSLPDIPEQQADERAGQRPGGSAAGFNQRRQVAAVWVRMGRRSRGLSSLRARSGQAQRHGRRLFLPSVGVCSWDQGEAPAAALRLPEAAARSHCSQADPLDPGATREREGNTLGRERERRGKGFHPRAGKRSGGANGLAALSIPCSCSQEQGSLSQRYACLSACSSSSPLR